jgi:predicted permease
MQEQEEGVRVFPPPLTAPIGATLVLRLLVAPAIMLALSALVVRVPDAFLIQAGMACGINSLAVAHIYGLDLRIVAGAVAWSTAIVLAAALVLAGAGVL